jgi:hypothetical protein
VGRKILIGAITAHPRSREFIENVSYAVLLAWEKGIG